MKKYRVLLDYNIEITRITSSVIHFKIGEDLIDANSALFGANATMLNLPMTYALFTCTQC